jgi:hypothetical protein
LQNKFLPVAQTCLLLAGSVACEKKTGRNACPTKDISIYKIIIKKPAK